MSKIATRASLTSHIATRAQLPQYFADLGMSLPNPDPILKALGKDIAVYRDLRSDPQVGGNIKRRRGAVLSMEWGIDAARAGSRATKNLESILADLDMTRLITEALDAPLYGYQPMEIIWGKVGSWFVPTDVIGKPPEWFCFDGENRLRLRTKAEPMHGVLTDPRKYLLPRQDATYDNPYGMPDLAMCFWPTSFKKGGLKFWVTFSEKYGSPFLYGKHPRNTPVEETDDLLEKLADMVQDAVAVIPDDASIAILESGSKGGSSEVYEKLLMFCRSEVNYAMLGQNQSSEANSTHASAKAGLEVTKDIRDADKRIVEGAVNTLIRWIWDYNFSDAARPNFSMWEQEEVDKVLAERDKTLKEAGLQLTPAYFKRAYKLQDGDIVETPIPSTQTATPTVAFAEGDEAFPDQAALDAALAGLADGRMHEQATAMLKPLVQLLADSADYAEALGKLAELFPKLDTDSLEEALTRAMFVAELWGQANGDD